MRRSLLGVAFAVLFTLTSGSVHASDAIELTTDDVTAVWRNINEIVLVLSENIALDDEWIAELRDLSPADDLASDPAALDREMTAFRERLDVLMTSSDLPAVSPLDGDELSPTSALYMRSGNLLDHLVKYLIAEDSLASVAIYYANADADMRGAGARDLAVEIDLANQRMDAFLEENGL